ncbi:MAG TPA: NAD(P)-dependent oxidoreductase [Thermomicrobiales bacterium]|nr:NAD(P)-dependent oxidoreductase [Thermomicrobiales bacterium]
MRVLLVGAGGVIGSRIVPRLVERGHDVVGTTTKTDRFSYLRALGAEPVVLDLLDPEAVRRVVREARPDAIINEATALTGLTFPRNLDSAFVMTNRLRTEGTDNLLAAAREAGVTRFVAQGFAPLRYARIGGPVKTEDDPLDDNPLPGTARTYAAVDYLDRTVRAAGGIVLRYGAFYGEPSDPLAAAIRKRQFPIVGEGNGVFSFVHLDDAAEATVLALAHDGAGAFNIADDDPIPIHAFLPAAAGILGAKPPRHVPVWIAKIIAGPAAVMLATAARGVSNEKAKRELGWQPRYASWREGFAATYGQGDDAMRRAHLRTA